MNAAEYWIDKLGLKHHPEGGYFKEVYRADEEIVQSALPERYSGKRSFATSIYFLLTGKQFSAFHRIKTDETWHFYHGLGLELFLLTHNGSLEKHLMGPEYESGERFQITIPRDHWFAARTTSKDGYALVGCTVSPGFHFEDFELADRKILLQEYPQHTDIINELAIG
jgi:predicted cupin superfamily sugar epimerase